MQLRLELYLHSGTNFRARHIRRSKARFAPILFSFILFLSPVFSWAAVDWSDDTIYFVLIDRYADGDSSNNFHVDRHNPGGYHGGDLKGLTQHLDEIADLGVTAIWINPVQKQIDNKTA
jgi:Alpha amylase, catalytic domain